MPVDGTNVLYVQKPFDTVDLVATVRTLLEGA
jgi:DNA-binding response OmpR family regulator